MVTRTAFVAALITLPATALAEEMAFDGPRFGMHVGVEHFNWTEQDPDQPSRELLEEEGPRLTAALTLDNFLRPVEGPVFGLEGRAYYGNVDYDGETQSGVPVKTDVDYFGGLAEARVGYRFVAPWSPFGFDVMAGLGGEYWSRDIQDGYDANGNRVTGYEEEYTVAYVKAGVGLADLSYEEWYGRLETGVRYPLEVDEQVDELDADLSPGNAVSLYATYELSKKTGVGRQMGITLYYDSYRLEESPLAQSSIGLVRQPESDMDVIGVRFGVFL